MHLRPSKMSAAVLTVLTVAGCSLTPVPEATIPSSTAPVTMTTIGALALPGRVGVTRVQLPVGACDPYDVPDTTFASGSAELVGDSAFLADLARRWTELDQLGVAATIRLIGHTDIHPTRYPGGNVALSRARAQAVRGALEDPYKLPARAFGIVEGVGEAGLIDLGSGPEADERNRRVEVIFICPDTNS